MNISRITKRISPFLTPIETKIQSEPVEHFYMLDKKGKILGKFVGDEESVSAPYVKDTFVSIHNHPDTVYNNTALAPSDIYTSVKNNEREARVITPDGFCHLVEIPKMSLSKENKCLGILALNIKYLWPTSWDRSKSRKLQKYLKKNGGFKFRTIPITPESKEFVKNLKRQKEVL